MADRYENDLLPRPNVEDIDIDTDFIRTLDENGVSYKDYMASIAQVIIETYGRSELAGTSRTVQQAFADLSGGIGANTNSINARTCTTDELIALMARLGIE